MDKPYLNQKEITALLGKSYKTGKIFCKHLLDLAEKQKYYIPETKRQILIPTELVKKVLKIK